MSGLYVLASPDTLVSCIPSYPFIMVLTSTSYALLLSTALSAVTASPISPLLPHWYTCDTSAPPLSSPLSVSTPLSTILSLGPYSPYVPQNSTLCRNVPDGFTVDQVTVLSRHGARSPTAGSTKLILAAVAAAKNTTGEVSDEAYAFIAGYNYTGFKADQLTGEYD